MRYIKKKSAVKPLTGKIVDTTNIDDKTTNTYSARVIDKMNTYSTEEQVIGTWINGKPLYRKTVNTGTLPNNTSKGINHNISSVDKILKVYGYATNGTAFLVLPSPHVSTVGASVNVSTTAEQILIGTGTDRTAFTESYITLEYTKTTD